MKRIIQFFAVCLALSALQMGSVMCAENVRNANKRDSKNVTAVTQSRTAQKSESARTTTSTVKSNKNVSAREASSNKTVKQRSADKNVTARTATTARNATVSRSAKSAPAKTISARTASRTANRNVSRAANLDAAKISEIKSKDYSKCKTVYYECMDEFCANKDTNLRRCACSARVHEFDNIKKQLSDAEDKMLDFNQRLLIVNLDKEDATAINTATEGESAFEKKDTSESEKLLQKITKSLNSSGDSKITNDLASISLSLDMDSAWDSIDSLSGIETTSKTGLDLYNAATPICVEMAREVCSDEELSIAQSGYKLTIQQDCNTVAKSYNSQYNNAMNKIHESSALLDMARLNNYQQRNSDDVLTCKKKMLEQLSNESVCGANLYKCLDTTGQYINPSTGEAFLSNNLYNLTELLTIPSGNETWSKLGQNEKFVSFLNSKKKFLDPATEQCQDIADTVWSEFIDDALAQIKLAQNSKLEEIRQSCTTLVAECKINNQTTLEDFDARALSSFSVIADTTVNALCKNVENSCTDLLAHSGGGGTEWLSGMTGIALDVTYDKIIETCTTVGKDCIIRQCTGTSGNFALCQRFESNPRHAILRRDACWEEVKACVNQAVNVNEIASAEIVNNREKFYKNTYGEDATVNPICDDNQSDRIACLLTEQIWGNCEYDPTQALTKNQNNLTYKTHNQILEPLSGSNLMSWFATNTGTLGNYDSCNAAACPVNYVQNGNDCSLLVDLTTSDDVPIHSEANKIDVSIADNLTNYCESGVKDYWGNCCADGKIYTDITNKDICVPSDDVYTFHALPVQDAYCTGNTCQDDDCKYYCKNFDDRVLTAYCVTTGTTVTLTGNNIICDGFWILIDNYGNYINTYINSYNAQSNVKMTYKEAGNLQDPQNGSKSCEYNFDFSAEEWQWQTGQNCQISTAPTNENFIIKYD